MGEKPQTQEQGAVALRFFDARGINQEHVDALPNDAVVTVFGLLPLGGHPGAEPAPTCCLKLLLQAAGRQLGKALLAATLVLKLPPLPPACVSRSPA